MLTELKKAAQPHLGLASWQINIPAEDILSLIELVENMADALRIAKSMTPHGGVSYVCNEALKKYGAMK